AGELDAIVDHRHFLGEGVEPRITPRRAFHERRQLGAEQIEAGVGDAPERAIALRGPRDHEGRAERAFILVRLLVVYIGGEVLRSDGAHIGLQVLVEQDVPDAKCAVRYLPTSPLELASPFGCLSVAEFSMSRGFCADHAARTTTLAS